MQGNVADNRSVATQRRKKPGRADAITAALPQTATRDELIEMGCEDGGARYSARTFTFSALAVASLFRNGRPKASDSISNTSPFCVATPSLKESVAVPK